MLQPQVANSPNTTSTTHSYTELYINQSIIVCYSRWALFPHTSLFWDLCICVCVLVFWAKLRQGVCEEWMEEKLLWKWLLFTLEMAGQRGMHCLKCKEVEINRQKNDAERNWKNEQRAAKEEVGYQVHPEWNSTIMPRWWWRDGGWMQTDRPHSGDTPDTHKSIAGSSTVCLCGSLNEW